MVLDMLDGMADGGSACGSSHATVMANLDFPIPGTSLHNGGGLDEDERKVSSKDDGPCGASSPRISEQPNRLSVSHQEACEGRDVKSTVVLNVGGRRFQTSKETLCSDPNSMLAAMAKRHMATEDDATFIDRDPVRFGHVLNYLRSRTIYLDCVSDLQAVQEEADFFSLEGLCELCEKRIAKKRHEVEVRDMEEKAARAELKDVVAVVAKALENLKLIHQRKEPTAGVRRRRMDYENLTGERVFKMDEDF